MCVCECLHAPLCVTQSTSASAVQPHIYLNSSATHRNDIVTLPPLPPPPPPTHPPRPAHTNTHTRTHTHTHKPPSHRPQERKRPVGGWFVCVCVCACVCES